MTTPRDDTPTRLESAAAALLRSQAAEIERLRAELGDLPEAQADMLRTIKELRAEAELFAKHVGIKLARKDALQKEIDRLRIAAQAVIDRWNSPKWDWHKQGPTADLMAALHTALLPDNAEVRGA